MEGPRYPPVFDPPSNRPTSPPATPGTPPNQPFVYAAGHFTPNWKPHPYSGQSPPLEHIQPTGHGHHFFYTRPQRNDLDSRPSSVSGAAFATRDDGSIGGTESVSDGPSPHEERTTRTVKDTDFEVEEVEEGESAFDSETDVVRPDGVEEAAERGPTAGQEDDAGVTEQFQELNCDDDSVDSDEERKRRYLERKKRWSTGLFKRSHSQSVGSDTEGADDTEGIDAQSVGSSTRRLRRRIRKTRDRPSLVLEDLGSTQINEEKEPDDAYSGSASGSAPPSLPSDQEGSAALPFWVLQDLMEIDSGSSGPPSMA